MMQKNLKNETLTYGYSSESTLRELSYEYQHDRFWMVFINLCLMFWTKVASALEGLRLISIFVDVLFDVIVLFMNVNELLFYWLRLISLFYVLFNVMFMDASALLFY